MSKKTIGGLLAILNGWLARWDASWLAGSGGLAGWFGGWLVGSVCAGWLVC